MFLNAFFMLRSIDAERFIGTVDLYSLLSLSSADSIAFSAAAVFGGTPRQEPQDKNVEGGDRNEGHVLKPGIGTMEAVLDLRFARRRQALEAQLPGVRVE